MRIRIDVDLEVPRWVRNSILGCIAAVALVGTGLGVKAWAGPITVQTFAQGETLTATKLNKQLTDLQDAVNQSAPAGTIIAFGGPIDGNPGVTGTTKPPPAGWLWCNGDALSGLNSTYAALYAAIGTAYGGIPSSQTFNLPELRGMFLRGVDGAAGNDPDAATRTAAKAGGNAGNAVGSVEGDAFASHNHGATDSGHTHSPYAGASGYAYAVATATCGLTCGAGQAMGGLGITAANSGATPTGYGAITVSAAGGIETRPKNAYVNFIIKY
jgi:microcystin-dependent protein